VSILREFIGPFLELCEKYLGIRIDPLWGEVIVAASVFIVFSIGAQRAYLWIRRRLFGDMSALPEEQLAMVSLIALDVKGIKEHIEQVKVSLDSSIGGKLEEALNRIATVGNDNPESDGTENGAKTARLFIASGVREAVLKKFLDGSWFVESAEPHIFWCEPFLRSGEAVRLQLQTPYRERRERERLDYVLEIWIDNWKVFNFEWDRGREWVRYLKAGPWVDQIAGWKVRRKPAIGPVQQAAE
jgi:hypothetical protein